jgi:hypothetical protein
VKRDLYKEWDSMILDKLSESYQFSSVYMTIE